MPKENLRLRRPPLVLVLAQIVVNPIANLGDYVPDIQARLRKTEFTDFKPVSAPTLIVEDGRFSFKENKIWSFLTRDKRTAIVLSPEAIVIQTSSYDHFAPFKERIVEIVGHVNAGVEGYSTRRRLGLRYVNQVIQIDDVPVSDLLQPGLLGFQPQHLESRISYSGESVFQMDKGALAVRFSHTASPIGLPIGIDAFGMDIPFENNDHGKVLLDIDRFDQAEYDFNIESLTADLTAFNVDAENAFRYAITDRALKLWKEEKIDRTIDSNI